MGWGFDGTGPPAPADDEVDIFSRRAGACLLILILIIDGSILVPLGMEAAGTRERTNVRMAVLTMT